MKKLVATLLLLVMTLAMTACGTLDINKIKGDWTLSSVGDQTIEEYAESLGATAESCYINWTVSDNSFTSTNYAVSDTYDIELKANGFEAMKNGMIVMSVVYKNDTLCYSVDYGNGPVEHVFVKGKNEFTASAGDTSEGTATTEA